MAKAIRVEWSPDALADLVRFADFLENKFPSLAPIVADELIDRAAVFGDNPRIGRPILGRKHERQAVLRVLKAQYVFQYRYDGKRLVILRVWHGRENRNLPSIRR